MLKWQGNLDTIEDIDKWIEQCSLKYNSKKLDEVFLVDLTQLGWLSPMGCTVLISTLDYFYKHQNVQIYVPENRDTIGYLERMDFFKQCDAGIKDQFENQINMNRFYDRVRNHQEFNLLEISKLSSPDNVDLFYHRIVKILRDKSIQRERLFDIANIFSELANNALEHSGAIPYACIQYYEATRTISISMCDTGQGIYKSLKDVVSPFLTSHAVIKKAIFTHASRHVNDNRGKGLMDVTSRAYNFSDVNFYIRTHNSSYIIKENDLILRLQSNYFLGTFYYLTIMIS
ncbi:hypothetical protein [Paenibacillus glycanilyticus]|uniref:hypothetical protein n=1 Tax=Paenibacillus glycanilyticus TaxID=126569 RepID=UPI003EBA943D